MKNPKELSQSDVIQTAKSMNRNWKRFKWAVTVEGREFAARPLVLRAAGVLPNHSINSHQSIKILERLGFETYYKD